MSFKCLVQREESFSPPSPSPPFLLFLLFFLFLSLLLFLLLLPLLIPLYACSSSSLPPSPSYSSLVFSKGLQASVLKDLHTESRDPEAYCQEAMFICAGTGSADSHPKAEPWSTAGHSLYIPFISFPFTFWPLCLPYRVTCI